jgi:hypothetical protein
MDSAQITELVTRIKKCFPIADVDRGHGAESGIIRIGFEALGDDPMLVWVYPETLHVFVETLVVFESCVETGPGGCIALVFPCGAVFPSADTDPMAYDEEKPLRAEWWFDNGDCVGFECLVYGLMSAAAEYYRGEILGRALAATIHSEFPTATVTRDSTEVRAAFQNDRIVVRVSLECMEDSNGLIVVHMSPPDFFARYVDTACCEVTKCHVKRFYRWDTPAERETVLCGLSVFVGRITAIASLAA